MPLCSINLPHSFRSADIHVQEKRDFVQLLQVQLCLLEGEAHCFIIMQRKSVTLLSLYVRHFLMKCEHSLITHEVMGHTYT
jgi:hypothetical protein